MRRTFKYRLLGSKQTLQKAEIWLGLCRNLYNIALEQRISAYKSHHHSVSCYAQMKQLPELKEAFPEFLAVNAHTLQEVIERLDRAYRAFFRRAKNGNGKAGFPRFKGRGRYDSFTLKDYGWKLDGKYLSITKIGRFKLRLSRPIEGNIKTVVIKRTPASKWYAFFSCDNVPEKRLPESGRMVGIDVGLKSFCVDSDGDRIAPPLYLRQAEAILRKKQRRLSRRIKGSKGREEARLQVAKLHEKIANQRRDFLHKVANHYIANYGVIFVEDLKIRNMVKNRYLSKSIFDASWGTFFELLSYKAEGAGRTLAKVNPQNTSQICSRCGERVEKTLAERIHRCPYCGLVLDRDENSAVVVLQAGQACRAITKQDAVCVARESPYGECQHEILWRGHRIRIQEGIL